VANSLQILPHELKGSKFFNSGS